MNIYTIIAQTGAYDDRNEAIIYHGDNEEECKRVLNEVADQIRCAMLDLALAGRETVDFTNQIESIAYLGSWEDSVYLHAQVQEFGVVGAKQSHVASTSVSIGVNEYHFDDIESLKYDDDPKSVKFETLARPYEEKYFGEKVQH